VTGRILVVEDDDAIATGLALNLKLAGHASSIARDGLEALKQAEEEDFALILLDINLPKKNGLEVLSTMRATDNVVPVIVLSAREGEFDKVNALRLGADDYVTKPFALEELIARVEAVIRRHRGKGGARLAAADVVVDLSEGLATRNGVRLPLTGIEFRILAALMRNSGQLVTYAQLAEAVWAVTTGPESNSLEVHISRIRQKLEQDGGSRLIHTVRGLGYRFSAE
jgi:DNA-binding response OmpR family regulator